MIKNSVDIEAIKSEIDILSSILHPNVSMLYEVTNLTHTATFSFNLLQLLDTSSFLENQPVFTGDRWIE